MYRRNSSTPRPRGLPMLHRQRGPGRALGMGRRIAAPSYPDLRSISSRLRVRGACPDMPSPTGSGMDTKMWPTLAPTWKQAYDPARRGTMQRVILTILAFATATVLSTPPVSAINTHAYNGSYCKATNGSQNADFQFDALSIVNVSSGTRSITCPILMDEAVYQTGIGANIYVFFMLPNDDPNDPSDDREQVSCTVYSLNSTLGVVESRSATGFGSGWLPFPGYPPVVPQPAITITTDSATYNMVCSLPPEGRLTSIQVDEND